MKKGISLLVIACLIMAVIPTMLVNAASKQQDIVTYAKHFKGSPYKFGGTSPSGFDCSGYILYVYKHFNISLPRTSADQYNVGTSISKNRLELGDLVFFEDTYKPGISHTGIYIGNNEFISATSSGVSIASLDNSYWKPKYAGAKRVIPTNDGFADLSKGDLVYDAAVFLNDKKIVQGFDDNTFRPNDPITRGQAAAIINRARPLKVNVTKAPFKDVPLSNRFVNDIAAMKEAGIINGFKDGTYRPDDFMTRADMALIVKGAFGIELGDISTASNMYEDIHPDYRAYEAIVAMKKIDQTNIFNTERFYATNRATRAVFSAAIYNSMKVNE